MKYRNRVAKVGLLYRTLEREKSINQHLQFTNQTLTCLHTTGTAVIIFKGHNICGQSIIHVVRKAELLRADSNLQSPAYMAGALSTKPPCNIPGERHSKFLHLIRRHLAEHTFPQHQCAPSLVLQMYM